MSAARELTLFTGRSIKLRHLEQYLTYGGLLLGYPTREMNRQTIERLMTSHTPPKGDEAAYLVKPAETPFELPAGAHRHGTPARLPTVTCIASFLSDRLRHRPDEIWSALTAIWFQDEFAFPIDPLVLIEIASIDWDAHAAAWEP